MFTPINGCTMNELTNKVYHTVLDDGRKQPSRNGDIMCINNAVLNLSDPASRHLYLEGRKSNIAAQVAETFWVMAGMDEIDPYLSFFLPRAKDYSDDGKTWRGAYGPRLYMYDQLKEAAEVFARDGWETRHSVVQILLPERDSAEAVLNTEGCEDGKTKDRPCNNELVFFMTPNEDGTYSLNMNVFQRSGDAIWGALNINVFEWTFLQELMVGTLNCQMDEVIVLGEYTHFVTNLHIYDTTANQARAVMSNVQESLYTTNHGKLIATGDVDNDREFFKTIVERLSVGIRNGVTLDTWNLFRHYLEQIFNWFGVTCEDNLLWEYVIMVGMYIMQKTGGVTKEDVDVHGITLNPLHKDFDDCCRASSFFKLMD